MTLRAVLVGAGLMGKNHARVLSRMTRVELVGVVDPNGDPLGLRGRARLFDSVERLPAGFADFAIVATPTSSHEATVISLLDSGTNVLVEKPLAGSTIAGLHMSRKLEETGLIGAVGHIERFNPAVRELKKRVVSGEVGEVYQIATRRQSSFPSRIADVGVTLDLASHDIELTRWVAGSRYKTVSAQTYRKRTGEHEDLVSVTGRLANGVVVNHIVNWLSPMKERVVVVTGEKGTLVANLLVGELVLHQNGAFEVDWDSFASFRGVTEGDVTKFAYPKKEPLVAELEEFCNTLESGGESSVSFQEGLEVLRVAEAIVCSGSENRSIDC